MGIAGTTAPCSGMEHAVSHLIEMATVKAGARPRLHGPQVGVSSVVAALLWHGVLEVLADGRPARARVPDAAAPRWRAVGLPWGRSERRNGDECWQDWRGQADAVGSGGRVGRRAAEQWPFTSGRLVISLLSPRR